MTVRKSIVAVALVALAFGAGSVAAQITEFEVKQGTVVSVWGNDLVVKMADGTVKNVEVPPDFRFNVEGEMLPLNALKPGMELTALVKTTHSPIDVYTTEVKHGEVLAASGRSVIIRTEEGTKKHTVDGDFPFWVDGEKKTVYDLKKGMKVTATIVSHEIEMVTDRDVAVYAAGDTPAPKAAPAARPAAPAAPAAPATLPKTGSTLPLAGLFGLLALALSAGIAVIRRF